jgi:hypothetical protein
MVEKKKTYEELKIFELVHSWLEDWHCTRPMVRQNLADVLFLFLLGLCLGRGRRRRLGVGAIEDRFVLQLTEFGVARFGLESVVAVGRRM